VAAGFAFTDSVGAATLTNSLAAPADRFAEWVPVPRIQGAYAEAIPGALHAFVFAQLYDVRVTLDKIPDASQDTVARFVRHLMNAGTVSITTGDAGARTYGKCQMVKGETPELAFDGELMEWAVTVTLRDVSAAPTEMLCIY
jgi:hypothetical protein